MIYLWERKNFHTFSVCSSTWVMLLAFQNQTSLIRLASNWKAAQCAIFIIEIRLSLLFAHPSHYWFFACANFDTLINFSLTVNVLFVYCVFLIVAICVFLQRWQCDFWRGDTSANTIINKVRSFHLWLYFWVFNLHFTR